jgi:multidrug efflux pump subunit AcrA (membrane-fusion protein)
MNTLRRFFTGPSLLRGPANIAKKTVLLCAGALIFFSACTGADKEAAAQEKAAQDAPVFAVNTTLAVQGRIRDYLPLSGDIVAGTTVDVYSDAAGKVVRVYASVGDRIARGAPIAAVDPSRAGMDYLPSVATAPIAGVLTSLPAQVGMTVNQSVPLARIAGGDALEIRLYVAERFISRISLRQPCEITLDAWPGESFRGSVSEIAPTVDPASRTMEVKVNVDNHGALLKAGMFAKVRIVTEEKEGVVKIPSAALIRRFGEEYVFIVEKAATADTTADTTAAAATDVSTDTDASADAVADTDTPAETEKPERLIARRKLVRPGILIDGVLEIEEGLAPDDEVVIRGQTLLEDGALVNVIDRVQSLSAN